MTVENWRYQGIHCGEGTLNVVAQNQVVEALKAVYFGILDGSGNPVGPIGPIGSIGSIVLEVRALRETLCLSKEVAASRGRHDL